MNSFKIDIYTEGQEEQLAHVDMLGVPRIGENLYLIRPDGGSWWRVLDVAYVIDEIRGHVCREAYIIVKPSEKTL